MVFRCKSCDFRDKDTKRCALHPEHKAVADNHYCFSHHREILKRTKLVALASRQAGPDKVDKVPTREEMLEGRADHMSPRAVAEGALKVLAGSRQRLRKEMPVLDMPTTPINTKPLEDAARAGATARDLAKACEGWIYDPMWNGERRGRSTRVPRPSKVIEHMATFVSFWDSANQQKQYHDEALAEVPVWTEEGGWHGA
jgi:hypothetical protein